MSRLPLLFTVALLGACARDISPEGGLGPSGGLPGPGGAQAKFAATGGFFQAQIDASGSDWVYLDLDTQQQVFPAMPESSDEWDLAHRGVDIKLNGGVSGAPPSGTEVAVYGDKVAAGSPYPFDTVDGAPPDNVVEYRTDQSGGLLGLGGPAYAMSVSPAADQSPNPITGAGDHGWYRQDSGGTIIARSNVGYVLRTVECRYYKLRMTSYVDDGGAAAHPRYDFAQIPGPRCSGGHAVAPLGRASFDAGSASTIGTLDASDENAWVYLDLSGAQQVAPADPANDRFGWDLAWRRTDLKVNGGISGASEVAIHGALRDDWDARKSVPDGGQFHTDETGALAFQTYPLREVGGECAFDADGDYGWYYYSGFCDKGQGLHHISPRDVVYVVRDRNGETWKLRVLSYYGSAGEAAHPRFEYAPITP
jgi:hypothetical protein